MPGDSPYQAVQAFLDPLQRSVSCLGTAKLTLSKGGKSEPNQTHAWTINGGDGLVVRSLGTLKASMHYEIILSEERHEGKWRVTTRSYAYELIAPDGNLSWSMHWHPVGRSFVTYAHLHLPAYGAASHHLRVDRQTFEMAIQWCIELGAAPAKDDWERVLMETEGLHKLHRSWAGAQRPSSDQ